MKVIAYLFATLAFAGVAGCSAEPSAPPPSSGDSGSTSVPAPAASPSSAAGPGCLTGTYVLKRLVGVGEQSTFGTGEGGDTTVAFSDGTYTLRGAGKEPMKLTLAGQTGQLLVDGTIAGTYSGDLPSIDFTVGASSGTATLSVGGQTRKLSMDQVGQVLAPHGAAQVQCQGDQLAVNLDEGVLELDRT